MVSLVYIMGRNVVLTKAGELLDIQKSSGSRIDPCMTPGAIISVVDLIF